MSCRPLLFFYPRPVPPRGAVTARGTVEIWDGRTVTLWGNADGRFVLVDGTWCDVLESTGARP